MITRDDRDILRKTLLAQAPQTKLKEFETAKVTRKVGNPKPPFTNTGAIDWELPPQGRTQLQQAEPVASATHFLRFGA